MVWLTIYSNTVVYGGKWVWWIWSLVYFHSFEALNDAFEVQYFQGFIFYTLPKTLIACRAMQLRFLKVKTFLNNAFNIYIHLGWEQQCGWSILKDKSIGWWWDLNIMVRGEYTYEHTTTNSLLFLDPDKKFCDTWNRFKRADDYCMNKALIQWNNLFLWGERLI